MTNQNRYDVALSFAGEDREYVEKVANCLKEAGIAVFYDKFEQTTLWGKNLYVHLNDLYKNKAKYCVVFISKHYKRKAWTNHEIKSAFDRTLESDREYILPARFDNTQIDGIDRSIAFIDLRKVTPATFAEIIIAKLNGTQPPSISAKSPKHISTVLLCIGILLALIIAISIWKNNALVEILPDNWPIENDDTPLLRGECGEAMQWTLQDGILTISGDKRMTDYAYDGKDTVNNTPWKDYREEITSVRIENGVTSIGDSAFSDCVRLTDISISDSVTSIGERAFAGCVNLSGISIPDSVISIGKRAFARCDSLGKVTIPDSVTGIGEEAFQGCQGLAEIFISDSVTNIGKSAFYGCGSLRSIKIPGGVINIEDATFAGCAALTQVTISNSVTDIRNFAFDGCGRLDNVTIPESVTHIGVQAFGNCSSLVNLSLPDSVTRIEEHAFAGCTSLSALRLPANITSIEPRAFAKTGLIRVEIPGNVTRICAEAFQGCSELTELSLPKSLVVIERSAFQDCGNLVSVIIPSSVVSIEDFAFAQCAKLTNVTIQGAPSYHRNLVFEGTKYLQNILAAIRASSVSGSSSGKSSGSNSSSSKSSSSNSSSSKSSGSSSSSGRQANNDNWESQTPSGGGGDWSDDFWN